MSDARSRNECQNAVKHAESRAQDGHDAKLLALKHLRVTRCDGRFDLHIAQREIARDLVRHKHCDLREQLAKLLRPRLLHAHERQFVLDERMVNEMETLDVGRMECISHGKGSLSSRKSYS